MQARRYIFVDRDGTLIEDRGYAYEIDQYARIPGALEGLKLLVEDGYRIAIVTNQSGLARGYFSLEQYHAFDAHLRSDFETHGVPIDQTLYCPHLPTEGCACRKPAPGLLMQAEHELSADLSQSWVIGDKPSDIELAERAGCRSVYLLTGQGQAH